MVEIKQREKVRRTIKTLDKGTIITKKTKSSLIGIKERGENSYSNTDENNANEYAVNKLNTGGKYAVYNSNKIKTKGNKAVRDTKDNFIKTKNKVKTIKSKLTEKKKIKEVKNKIKTSKNIVKDTPKVARQTGKTTERAKQLAIKTAKTTYNGVKAVFKVTVSAVKSSIAGTKALISLLLAGGWIAIIIIVVMCLIGMFLNSYFGIFFSNQKNSINDVTMKDVILECNQDFYNKIQSIKDDNIYDECILDGNMASWKDIIIVYTAKLFEETGNNDIAIITDERKLLIKNIFWDMNTLSSIVKKELVTESELNNVETSEKIEKNILHININSKTLEQMEKEYNFNQLQLNMCNELLNEKYSSLWSEMLYEIDSDV